MTRQCCNECYVRKRVAMDPCAAERADCRKFVVTQSDAAELRSAMHDYHAGEITFGRLTELLEDWVNELAHTEANAPLMVLYERCENEVDMMMKECE